MTNRTAFCPPPKLVYVDYRGIESYRYTPGALTQKQFEEYLRFLQSGINRESARRMAAETPRR